MNFLVFSFVSFQSKMINFNEYFFKVHCKYSFRDSFHFIFGMLADTKKYRTFFSVKEKKKRREINIL